MSAPITSALRACYVQANSLIQKCSAMFCGWVVKPSCAGSCFLIGVIRHFVGDPASIFKRSATPTAEKKIKIGNKQIETNHELHGIVKMAVSLFPTLSDKEIDNFLQEWKRA